MKESILTVHQEYEVLQALQALSLIIRLERVYDNENALAYATYSSSRMAKTFIVITPGGNVTKNVQHSFTNLPNKL
jgi:hypothetical protein